MADCNSYYPLCAGMCLGLGYSYVPLQKVDRFYDYPSALACGSLFPDLCIPIGKYGPNELAPGR